MSDQTRHARLSRLDPINWPPGTGIVIFIGWLAYAAVSTVWIHPLLWTVLPLGLALFLFAERYPWLVNLVIVAPLVLLTASAQFIAASSEAPTVVAFGIYLIACAYFSVVTCIPDRDAWIAHLPRWFLGEHFAARLSWIRFEDTLVAANAIVRDVGTSDDQGARHATMERLATGAKRESRRVDAWRDAWVALAGWLDGLIELVGVEPTPDQVRHVHQLLTALDEAHLVAIERTGLTDPA